VPAHLPTHSIENASCFHTPNVTCIISNLTLIDVSQGKSGGKYTLTAKNDCGSADVFVNVEVYGKTLC